MAAAGRVAAASRRFCGSSSSRRFCSRGSSRRKQEGEAGGCAKAAATWECSMRPTPQPPQPIPYHCHGIAALLTLPALSDAPRVLGRRPEPRALCCCACVAGRRFGFRKQRACVPCPTGFTTNGVDGATTPLACGECTMVGTVLVERAGVLVRVSA